MSIRKKIIYGYGISLGLAFTSTVAVFAVGNYHQHQALDERQIASKESQLLSKLQLDILYNRPTKQLSPYVQDPIGFQRDSRAMLERIRQIRVLLQNHNQPENPATLDGLQDFLDEYEHTVEAFQRRTEIFVQQAQPLTQTPEGSQVVQQLIVDLAKSPEFVAFIEGPDRMAGFYRQATEREVRTENALKQAEVLRTQIILGSLGLSLAIAIVLAFYISRAIARPIQAVTAVAQKITHDSNFELRAPIFPEEDEVSVLAQAINSMVEQVKQLMDEQQAYTHTIEHANVAAQAASQAKSEFLANMSHELRTPLNGILGYAQILNRTPTLSSKDRSGVDVIHKCGTHLLTLINDILDLSKIEARKLELTHQPLQLPDLVQGVVEICHIRAQQKGIDLIYQPAPDLPQSVRLDEKRIRQVLLNLLGNAVKFTDQGSVTLSVEVAEVIEPQPDPDPQLRNIRFQVEDTGVGIAPEDIQKLFQAFEQVGDPKQQTEGTGLGLAISQRLVQMMGGRIQVDSQPGVGSTFFFELTLPLAANSTAPPRQPNGRIIQGYQGKRRRLLILDDRWENRSVLINMLEPLGFEFSEAQNGQEGLERLKSYQPDLVITDLVMPVMDGFEFLRQVRNAETLTPSNGHSLSHSKIIVSSATVSKENQQLALDQGGDAFLLKPVEMDSLLKLLEEQLELEWCYAPLPQETAPLESSQESSRSKSSPSDIPETQEAGRLLLPSEEILRSYLELARRGRLPKLRKQLQALVQDNRNYQAFASPLLSLEQQFNVVGIENQLHEYLEYLNEYPQDFAREAEPSMA